MAGADLAKVSAEHITVGTQRPRTYALATYPLPRPTNTSRSPARNAGMELMSRGMELDRGAPLPHLSMPRHITPSHTHTHS